MIRIRLAVALAATALAMSSLPTRAQDRAGQNFAATLSEASASGAAAMGLAQDLYAVSVAEGDAVGVLAAARLANSVNLITIEATPLDTARIVFAEGADGGLRKTAVPAADPEAPAPMAIDGTPRVSAKATFLRATSEEEGAARGPVSAEAMFAKARVLAREDEALLGLIDDTIAEGPPSRVSDAVAWLSPLSAGQTDVWELPFHASIFAEVAILGDGDANLDVAVTDETGNLICTDVSWSDIFQCDWTPARDGYVYVTVQNLGGSRNSYFLLAN
jgi:hypothetical protein